MFYKELYIELGKLFFYISNIDGKVYPVERQSLQQLIQSNWKPLENSFDEYGTDQAHLIDFAFDYEEAEGYNQYSIELFEAFYLQNESMFSSEVIHNILQTGNAIAQSYRSKNKKEQEVLDRLVELFKG